MAKLSKTQLQVLRILAYPGEALHYRDWFYYAPCWIVASTMRKVLCSTANKLMADGLIERHDGQRRQCNTATITPAGRKAVEEADNGAAS